MAGERWTPVTFPDFVLTIDDFRQFASGKYNAGANPGRIGAHHAWERLESKDIDSSEAASIRLAFAFALEDAGVSGAKMAAACKRLGLEADFSFSNDDATVTPPSPARMCATSSTRASARMPGRHKGVHYGCREI